MGVTVLKRKWTQESRTERRNGEKIPVISRDKKTGIKIITEKASQTYRHVGSAVIPKKTSGKFCEGWTLMFNEPYRSKTEGEENQNKRLAWLSPAALSRSAGVALAARRSGGWKRREWRKQQNRRRAKIQERKLPANLNWWPQVLLHKVKDGARVRSVPDFIPVVWVRVHMWRPVYAASFNHSSRQQRRIELLNKKINDEFPFTPVKKPINYITGVTCFDLSFVTFSVDRPTVFLTFKGS